MAIIATSAVLALAGLSAAAHQLLEYRVKGTITHIHTNDTLYDKQKYGHILDYDKHSLILHGEPTLILSGEFHYWRLPDQSRWRPILEQYRSAGLNCIRIYFHWGFHSPKQGQYDFSGNRDINYLLDLCEEIGLYVLAAPGPYICAETQAGGFPIWLAAMRDVRLRHMKSNFWKTYDPEFMKYCVEYFENILPILARHQITNGQGGCVLGLQIENESFQHVFHYPIGLHDDMRVLAKTARDCGVTVPLFTNDGFEEGSFIVKDDPKRKKKDFGVDLYGFDKYVVFTPNSEPTSWVVGRDPSYLQEWDPSTVVKELEKMEKKVRSFGHANKRTPIFIPELQGGWFNHYGIKYTYDAIYRFYGDDYTRLMLDTVFSQGCTMLNFYMFYGGTNWGTIGDPDVYTSYDYSACIRENGLMSGRLRNLRKGLLFLQSFSDIMVRTDAVLSSKLQSVRSSLDKTISLQRQSLASAGTHGPVELTFLRNFSPQKVDCFDLFALSTAGNVVTRLSCNLAYKASFIALGNYTTINPDIHLVLSATPIHIRAYSGSERKKKEVWIAALAEFGATEMAFRGDLALTSLGGQHVGASGIRLRSSADDKDVKVVTIPEGAKHTHVVLSSAVTVVEADEASSNPELHIIFLDKATLSTLYCYYNNRHGDGISKAAAAVAASQPKIVTWGSYNAYYNPHTKILTADSTESQTELHVLTFGQDSSLLPPQDETIYGPRLAHKVFPLKANGPTTTNLHLAHAQWVEENCQGMVLENWEIRRTDVGALPWQDCPRKSKGSKWFKNVQLDYHFTSGHILYRGKFTTRERDVKDGSTTAPKPHEVWLKFNMRHRITAFVNGVAIGSHMVYSRTLLSPGAKVGHDPISFGGHKFLVPPQALFAGITQPGAEAGYRVQEHEIFLVIDSVGLSRMPFVLDDVRNPRGLLSAHVQGISVVKNSETWQVTGVDVRNLDMVHSSTGFPDEHQKHGWSSTPNRPHVDPNQGGVHWWRTHFEGPPGALSGSGVTLPGDQSMAAHIPLCLRIEGEFSAMIILNNILVGRYFGSDSPQHDFYMMDGLVHKAGSGQLNELMLMIYGSTKADENGDSDDNRMRIRLLPWIVEDAQGQLNQWSGNTQFDVEEGFAREAQAGPFWTEKQAFHLSALN
ncbi:hypothetical protein KI688_011606 [Linnemannia hyalina]|uniref:Glycoside hydrolase 35 catalytic domain-containing protein n=1 Tax=Linnemannia hyalina TaxID=64524 RepID=A0A9P7XVG6_9FUNG|nr:hypothetical protein KI688_011606 [Linnemannia hyalina]